VDLVYRLKEKGAEPPQSSSKVLDKPKQKVTPWQPPPYLSVTTRPRSYPGPGAYPSAGSSAIGSNIPTARKSPCHGFGSSKKNGWQWFSADVLPVKTKRQEVEYIKSLQHMGFSTAFSMRSSNARVSGHKAGYPNASCKGESARSSAYNSGPAPRAGMQREAFNESIPWERNIRQSDIVCENDSQYIIADGGAQGAGQNHPMNETTQGPEHFGMMSSVSGNNSRYSEVSQSGEQASDLSVNDIKSLLTPACEQLNE